MTVTMFSLTPPTVHTTHYFLRATKLNGPRTEPMPRRDIIDDARQAEDIRTFTVKAKPTDEPLAEDDMEIKITLHSDHPLRVPDDTILEDIDDWYSQSIEDDGFLERLDRSAESVRFP